MGERPLDALKAATENLNRMELVLFRKMLMEELPGFLHDLSGRAKAAYWSRLSQSSKNRRFRDGQK